LIVLLIWAGIYLPSLGVLEFKREESRGVIPAIAMLETGNWVVPSIGDKYFYSKPPGINWLVAISFLTTGEKSEFTARLPSVLFVLTFVVVLIWMDSSWLSLRARFIAAIIFLTNAGIIESGRMIETDGVYICLTGIATLWWLNIRSQDGSKWALWIIPCMVVGFGGLVKGPFIAMFFYFTVLAVLLYEKRIKDFFAIQHIIGIVIMAVMTFGWLYAASLQAPVNAMAADMWGQFITHTIVAGRWYAQFLNFLKSLVGLLPWLLFIPILWDKKSISCIESDKMGLFKGCRLGLVVGFAVICLMPGTEARYSMPLLPLASLLLGWMISMYKLSNRVWKNLLLVCSCVLCLSAIAGVFTLMKNWTAIIVVLVTFFMAIMVFRKRALLKDVVNLSIVTGIVTVIVMLQYAVFGMAILKAYETDRPAAQAVNRIVPSGETIYLYNSRHQGFYFYIRKPFKYLIGEEQVGKEVHYLVLEEKILENLKAKYGLDSRSPKILYEFTEKIPTKYRLIKLD
jgi:4-amino-4-deoxy-L-arabinose transferase-like glycosyltransferase